MDVAAAVGYLAGGHPHDLAVGEMCIRDRYGVPPKLSELGVAHDQLPAVARQARYDGAALYNEAEITLDDALEILEATY